MMLLVELSYSSYMYCRKVGLRDIGKLTILEKNGYYGKVKGMERGFRLDSTFFDDAPEEVAKKLLGKVLVTKIGGELTAGRIVEVEAYGGVDDRASHVFGGRVTERSRNLMLPPGHAYIYRIYGRYLCFNVVTGGSRGSSVFVRALEPVDGVDVMKKRRGVEDERLLTSGPSRLCMALGITMELNGEDVTRSDKIGIYEDGYGDFQIVETGRINIDYAGSDRDRPWRFYIKDNRFVSRR